MRTVIYLCLISFSIAAELTFTKNEYVIPSTDKRNELDNGKTGNMEKESGVLWRRRRVDATNNHCTTLKELHDLDIEKLRNTDNSFGINRIEKILKEMPTTLTYLIDPAGRKMLDKYFPIGTTQSLYKKLIDVLQKLRLAIGGKSSPKDMLLDSELYHDTKRTRMDELNNVSSPSHESFVPQINNYNQIFQQISSNLLKTEFDRRRPNSRFPHLVEGESNVSTSPKKDTGFITTASLNVSKDSNAPSLQNQDIINNNLEEAQTSSVSKDSNTQSLQNQDIINNNLEETQTSSVSKDSNTPSLQNQDIINNNLEETQTSSVSKDSKIMLSLQNQDIINNNLEEIQTSLTPHYSMKNSDLVQFRESYFNNLGLTNSETMFKLVESTKDGLNEKKDIQNEIHEGSDENNKETVHKQARKSRQNFFAPNGPNPSGNFFHGVDGFIKNFVDESIKSQINRAAHQPPIYSNPAAMGSFSPYHSLQRQSEVTPFEVIAPKPSKEGIIDLSLLFGDDKHLTIFEENAGALNTNNSFRAEPDLLKSLSDTLSSLSASLALNMANTYPNSQQNLGIGQSLNPSLAGIGQNLNPALAGIGQSLNPALAGIMQNNQAGYPHNLGFSPTRAASTLYPHDMYPQSPHGGVFGYPGAGYGAGSYGGGIFQTPSLVNPPQVQHIYDDGNFVNALQYLQHRIETLEQEIYTGTIPFCPAVDPICPDGYVDATQVCVRVIQTDISYDQASKVCGSVHATPAVLNAADLSDANLENLLHVDTSFTGNKLFALGIVYVADTMTFVWEDGTTFSPGSITSHLDGTVGICAALMYTAGIPVGTPGAWTFESLDCTLARYLNVVCEVEHDPPFV